MNKRFEFVGTIKPITDKYIHVFDTGLFSGKTLVVRMTSGTNVFYPRITGFAGQGDIYTIDTNNQKLIVTYENRKDPSVIKNVAKYKLFTFMPSAGDKREYISPMDFIKDVAEHFATASGRYRISGEYAKTFNDRNNKWTDYDEFNIQSITYVPDDVKDSATINLPFYFTSDVDDTENSGSEDKFVFNGFVPQWVRHYGKREWFAPMTLKVDKKMLASRVANVDATMKLLKNYFKFPPKSKSEVREIAVKCEYINGAPVSEFTEKDMSEDERMAVEAGLLSLEDVMYSHSKGIVGDKIVEFDIIGLMPSFSGGAIDTQLEKKTLYTLPFIEGEEKPQNKPVQKAQKKEVEAAIKDLVVDEDEVEDIFDPDDEI